ncbi:hypothetical protein BC834DRAFT_659364 [Gloeopeniophorella convolvens]|nr:hypothetical protein BC834DRAFT_659364 [Gloeopeniophorella convolvens]
MIDLTQGEGNKRVRKRNKKPTKGQLAAQAAAEAYRASARLPGQGEGPRPEPYPPPTQSQATIADGREDIDYQVPLMRTNLVTAPAGADLRRFPRENVDSDANIDPALRDQPMYDSSSGKARSQLWGQGRPATGSQAISSHHLPSSAQTQPPPHRASSLSVSQPHPQSLQSAPHVQYASQQLPVQPTYQRSSSAPQPAYQYAVQPTAQHLVQSDVRVPHPTQTSPQPLPMHQLFPTLPSAQPHPAPQTQARLPPMRTLSGSPTPDIPSSNESQNTVPGFARFASVAVGFPKQSFDSIDAARLRVEQSPGKGKGRAEPDSDSGERQSRRFVPPPPRAGLEHVNKGGLLSARRVSERYDEGSVDWLNRLDEDEGQSTFTQEPLEQSESVRVRGDEIA